MFLKAFQIKSNVQMKGSDVKKMKQKLAEAYSLSENDLTILFPSKGTYNIVKIVTHGGDNVNVLTLDKRPMFFEFEDRWFPTVYSLWEVSSEIPYFTTQPQVNKLKIVSEFILLIIEFPLEGFEIIK